MGTNGVGTFKDISSRMDVFAERAFIDGWELEKVVWTVPQGFGAEEYVRNSYVVLFCADSFTLGIGLGIQQARNSLSRAWSESTMGD